jgi:hypothetical protein
MIVPFKTSHPQSPIREPISRITVRSALTRLELVIISFLALVLAGLAITAIGRQRETSNEKLCANNLRRIGAAILGYHEEMKFLPAARIAPGYATWAVQIAAHLDKDSPLAQWDLAKRYVDQPAEARTVILPTWLCPARSRSFWESAPSKGPDQDPLPGALGDYACASGDGDPQRPWTGPLANGAIILGEVLDEKNGLIVRWQSRTTLASLSRGQSYTLAVGEKHVPLDKLGEAAVGDGSLYDGALPTSSARIGGPGFGLAQSPVAPFNTNFGSAHPGICQVLHADGSVHAYANAIPENVLGTMIRRD